MNETEPTNQETASARPFAAADLIRRGESLMVEFKSDRKCLPDQELVCAAVALANSDGGVVLVGVEDDGMMLRRCLKMDGSPESVPLYPHEIVQRQSSLGRLDPSAMPLPDVSVADMDPIQRIRIRQAIQKYGGDKSLLPLSDDEHDGALGFVRTVAGVRRPTLALARTGANWREPARRDA